MRYPRAVTRTNQISGLEHTMTIAMTDDGGFMKPNLRNDCLLALLLILLAVAAAAACLLLS